MTTAEIAKTDTSADSTNNSNSSVSESSPIALPDRLVVVAFMIVGFLLGMILILDLLAGLFR
jgi:hypothetical protein